MTMQELGIRTIWRDILQTDRVGLGDNFFDVGGHSLLLVKVQNAIEMEFGLKLPVLDLLRHTTIRALAKFVAERMRDQT